MMVRAICKGVGVSWVGELIGTECGTCTVL